jgi:predicted SAM-dependent methyltransferase
MKYHLGCGSQYMEGYCNVDFPPSHHNVNHDIKVDLYANILEMEYQECKEIRSHHFFEHFNYFETFALLFKWTNALEKEGLLIIDVPDLEGLCRAYLAADVKTKFLVARYLFGSHEAEWAYHINGWSRETMQYVLMDLGYSIEDVKRYGSPNTDQPNCGLTMTARKKILYSQEEILSKLDKTLELYKNGSTDFEDRLGKYFQTELRACVSKNK